MSLPYKPILRSLDFQPVIHQGQQMWLLRDPLQLSPQQLIFPTALAQMLFFCDGTRTLPQIHHDFSQHLGMPIDFHLVHDTLAHLDEACLLHNERAQAAETDLLIRYRAQPHRPPALAGLSYPAAAADLRAYFAEFTAGVTPRQTDTSPWRGRGIISPHIDYLRGGSVYAQTWAHAAAAAREADLIVILGTDHNGGQALTLTEKPYATPFGVLPTDTGLVGRLAAAIGQDVAFASELNHRQEHSVELSAVWLHYALAGTQPCPMIPVLVGSFHRFVANGHHPAQDERLNRFIGVLQQESLGKKVMVVASVDLAHVGPAFGDDFVLDAPRRAALAQSDRRLLAAIMAGDVARFYGEIAGIQDRNRICGFAPIYLLLRYLEATQGQEIAYQHCPADNEDNSLVSICGVLLE